MSAEVISNFTPWEIFSLVVKPCASSDKLDLHFVKIHCDFQTMLTWGLHAGSTSVFHASALLILVWVVFVLCFNMFKVTCTDHCLLMLSIPFRNVGDSDIIKSLPGEHWEERLDSFIALNWYSVSLVSHFLYF